MNYTFRDPDKLTMTYTGLLPGKNEKQIPAQIMQKSNCQVEKY